MDAAIAAYYEALAIKPDYAEAHNNLGAALKGLGKLDEPIAGYHKTLAIKPDFPGAYSKLGNTLLILGQYNEGLKLTRKGKGVIEFSNDKSRHFQILKEQDSEYSPVATTMPLLKWPSEQKTV